MHSALEALCLKLEARLRQHPLPSPITHFAFELRRYQAVSPHLHVTAFCADEDHTLQLNWGSEREMFYIHHLQPDALDEPTPFFLERDTLSISPPTHAALLACFLHPDEALRQRVQTHIDLPHLSVLHTSASLQDPLEQTWTITCDEFQIAQLHQHARGHTWSLDTTELLSAIREQGRLSSHPLLSTLRPSVLGRLRNGWIGYGPEVLHYILEHPGEDAASALREGLRVAERVHVEYGLLLQTLRRLDILDASLLSSLGSEHLRRALLRERLDREDAISLPDEDPLEYQAFVRRAQPEFGDLRAALHTTPSAEAFDALTALIPFRGLEEPAHTYTQEQLGRWPDDACVAPNFWLPWPSEEPPPALRYARALHLPSTPWKRGHYTPNPSYQSVTVIRASWRGLQHEGLTELVRVFPNTRDLEIIANGCKDASPLLGLSLHRLCGDRNRWRDDAFEQIASLPLARLSLRKCELLAANAAALAKLQHCRHLDLSQNPIGTLGLEHLLSTRSPLEHVCLMSCQINDVTPLLEHDLGVLKTLDLTRNSLSRKQAQALHEHCVARGVTLSVSQPVV